MAGKSRAFVAQRREAITRVLRENGRVSVTKLAKKLDVSPLTVRRDLDYLEEHGVATRRYGEAVLSSEVQERQEVPRCLRVKRAIAARTAQLVSDNELVFINTSSTALAVVEFIGAQGVTVVTNSVTSQELTSPPGATVLVTGGEVRPPRGVLSGEFALNNVRSVSATTCFVGCAGLSLATGVTSITQQEAIVNSLMVERSARTVLLAGSNKIGVGAGFTYASLDQIDLLITDEDADEATLSQLRSAGVKEIELVAVE